MKTVMVFIPGLWGGDAEYITETIPQAMAARGIEFIVIKSDRPAEVWDEAKFVLDRIRDDLANGKYNFVHLVGHSMGGLVGRFLIHNCPEDMKANFRSFTTMSTPHMGTPWAVDGNPIIDQIHPAINDMTYDGARRLDLKANLGEKPWLLVGSVTAAITVKSTPSFIERYLAKFLGAGAASLPYIQAAGAKMGFLCYELTKKIQGDYQFRREYGNAANDGVVPLTSQRFYRIIQHMEVSHVYFCEETPFKTPNVFDFYKELFLNREMAWQQSQAGSLDVTGVIPPPEEIL